jgi:hypothetical protein
LPPEILRQSAQWQSAWEKVSNSLTVYTVSWATYGHCRVASVLDFDFSAEAASGRHLECKWMEILEDGLYVNELQAVYELRQSALESCKGGLKHLSFTISQDPAGQQHPRRHREAGYFQKPDYH